MFSTRGPSVKNDGGICTNCRTDFGYTFRIEDFQHLCPTCFKGGAKCILISRKGALKLIHNNYASLPPLSDKKEGDFCQYGKGSRKFEYWIIAEENGYKITL